MCWGTVHFGLGQFPAGRRFVWVFSSTLTFCCVFIYFDGPDKVYLVRITQLGGEGGGCLSGLTPCAVGYTQHLQGWGGGGVSLRLDSLCCWVHTEPAVGWGGGGGCLSGLTLCAVWYTQHLQGWGGGISFRLDSLCCCRLVHTVLAGMRGGGGGGRGEISFRLDSLRCWVHTALAGFQSALRHVHPEVGRLACGPLVTFDL